MTNPIHPEFIEVLREVRKLMAMRDRFREYIAFLEEQTLNAPFVDEELHEQWRRDHNIPNEWMED